MNKPHRVVGLLIVSIEIILCMPNVEQVLAIFLSESQKNIFQGSVWVAFKAGSKGEAKLI